MCLLGAPFVFHRERISVSDSSDQNNGQNHRNTQKRGYTEIRNQKCKPAAYLWHSYNIGSNHI